MARKYTDEQIDIFLFELIKGVSQRKAYRFTWPASKRWKDATVDSKACNLLKEDKIKARYKQLKEEVRQRTTENGVRSVTDILNSIAEVVDRCMQKEPVMAFNRETGEWYDTGEWKFEHSGALKGLELYGKHLKMFTDKIETQNETEVTVTFNIPRPKDKKKQDT